MELIVSILAAVVMYEACVWLTPLSEWLLERALRRLPPELQEQYREEWRAHLRDMPNSLVKLVHAVSHLVQIDSLTRQFFESQFDEIDEMRHEVSKLQQGAASKILTLRRIAAKQQDRNDLLVSELAELSQMFEDLVATNARWTVEVYKRHAETSAAAILRVWGNSHLAMSIARSARARVEQDFDRDRAISNYEALYLNGALHGARK